MVGAGLALGLLATPALAAPVPGACGGLRFENGRLETGSVLAPRGPQTEACLKEIAEALKARPAIRSVTVAARLPDAERLEGQGLAVARAAADVLVNAGVPRTRVSVVAPPSAPDAPGQLQLAYIERAPLPAVARLRAASGDVAVGPNPAELRPRVTGDALYTGELVNTAKGAQAELALADGSVVRVAQESLVRLGTLELTAQMQRKVQLELLHGTVETEAAKGGVGSVFEVRTRGAVAGVRGTRFRVSAQGDGTSRLETLEGKVALAAERGEVDVNGGFGSRAKPDHAPEAPRALLAAPLLGTPRGGTFPTAPKLTWKAVQGASSYRVELARAADFATGTEVQVAPGLELTVPPALTGKWFWRVLAVDADGFIGYPSKIYTFDVHP
ncbi:FecR domain-containing protein [Myxococcaceae bacterium JPH2]|nr:FecR domain-containing protein [Myxococcaceae bacterium JPH2]